MRILPTVTLRIRRIPFWWLAARRTVLYMAVWAAGVKGAQGWFAKAVIYELEGRGYGLCRIILKSDGEHSTMASKQQVRSLRRGELVMEETPVGESQLNGFIERCNASVNNQFRTMIYALKHRIGASLSTESPVFQLTVRWLAASLTRYHIGKDGIIAWERIRGRESVGVVAKFGEVVLYRELSENKMRKENYLKPRWKDGVWSGACATSK